MRERLVQSVFISSFLALSSKLEIVLGKKNTIILVFLTYNYN